MPEEVVTAVLIEFRIFHRHDGVNQIARELVVRDGLAVFDVDLAEDFFVAIENHAGRFHLLELAEIVGLRLATQIGGEDDPVDERPDEENADDRDRQIELLLGIPRRLVMLHVPTASGVGNWHARRAAGETRWGPRAT